MEDVLASRMISDPLTLLMCSPVGDGSAALVLASRQGLRALDDSDDAVVRRAASRAYAEAAIEPDDIDVIELHEAAARAELIASEEIGVALRGRGTELLRSGGSAIAGRIAINPSGGLLSKGHPIGATGCSQIVEVVDQLRGRCGARQVDGANVSLAENGGGWLRAGPPVATITILARHGSRGARRAASPRRRAS